MKYRSPYLFFFTLTLLGNTVQADFLVDPMRWQVRDGGNGHYYGLYFSEDITWTEADALASQLRYRGSHGHLVSITSAAENAFVETTFGSLIGDPNAPGGLFPFVDGIRAWIGLTDVLSEGDFQWTTGEPAPFSDWAGPEPNNLGNEDFVHVWRRDFGSGPNWSWNDSGDVSGPVDGFIVEFDKPPGFPRPNSDVHQSPEPSSGLLCLLSGLVFTSYRRVATRSKR
ncbi:lectin-like protein [Thalassoglobus sp. JC818]|uniref:lectin-like protein n=1 Tax=Thalassoglobus sp. JC818 TaxID=3232136 RepID=UPI003457B5A6